LEDSPFPKSLVLDSNSPTWKGGPRGGQAVAG
jgi:hypothetical protein